MSYLVQINPITVPRWIKIGGFPADMLEVLLKAQGKVNERDWEGCPAGSVIVATFNSWRASNVGEIQLFAAEVRIDPAPPDMVFCDGQTSTEHRRLTAAERLGTFDFRAFNAMVKTWDLVKGFGNATDTPPDVTRDALAGLK